MQDDSAAVASPEPFASIQASNSAFTTGINQEPQNRGSMAGGNSSRSGSRPSSALSQQLSASFKKKSEAGASNGGDAACSIHESPIPSMKEPETITEGEILHSFQGHTGGLRSLAVSHDGSKIYSGGEDKSIRTWSVGLGGFSPLHTVQDAHGGWVWSILEGHQGEALYSGAGDACIKVWSVANTTSPPQLLHVVSGHHAECVCSLAISRDSAYLYSGSDDKTIRVWDISMGPSQPPIPLQTLTGHASYVSSLALSHDGLTLYSSGHDGDGSIRMWRGMGLMSSSGSSSGAGAGAGASGKCKILATLKSGGEGGIYTIALSPDGRILFSGGEDRSILVWSVDGETGTGHMLKRLDGAHDRWVRSIRIRPDGTQMFSGSADSTVGVWDLDANGGVHLVQKLSMHTDRVRCVRISPCGKYVFSASSDRTIKAWGLQKRVVEDK